KHLFYTPPAMPLSAGTRLGRYHIRSLLGSGGMGEVYLAHDPKIGRDVAIKVLPSALTTDADRLRRFEQEAQAAGALNHPNILSIYDVETHDGAPFIVSELLEGETLRERMGGAALPTRKAIDYALQIAHGLATAHAKGIVHRDLKPENIFVTRDGQTKILDFGIAKLTESPDGNEAHTEVPTRKLNTGPGVVMGTVGYMSPEQVRGRPVDHRSDIFSFGAVLHEMLTGKRAFGGDSVAEAMSAILKEEPPDISEGNGKIPLHLERVVRHCLEKRPEERFQSASDLCFALEALSTPSGSWLETATVSSTVKGGGGRRLLGNAWLGLAAALFLIGLLALLPLALAHLRHAPPDERVVKLSLLPPEKASLGGIALSPDGRRLAFAAVDGTGKSRLFLRSLDALAAQPLAGTDDAAYPFWSPDSRFIGFFAEGKLKKFAASGGPPQTICNAPIGRGGAWNRDDVIIFSLGPGEGLYRISAAGGEPSPLTTPDRSRQENSHRWPQFLPDGRSFLYLSTGPPESQGVYLGSLDSKETRRLLPTDSSALYAPPGYLLFRRAGTLLAQAFDPQKLELTGEAFPLPEQVGGAAGSFYTYLTVSQNGMLACHTGNSDQVQLAWFDRGGKQVGVTGSPGDYINLALAPDGKRVAFDSVDPQTMNRDLSLLELARGTPMRFIFDPATDWFPVWSPDGSRLVFSSNRAGLPDLYQKAASGAGSDELLLKSSNAKLPTDWSRDERFILYLTLDPKTKEDIWVLPLEGDRQPFPLLQTEFNEAQARFSPNGKWIAYTSDESGTLQVYVQSFPATGAKWPVSTSGGDQPRWRRDGRELFYLAADGKLMAVEVKTEGTFEAGVPKPLFETRIPHVAGPSAISYAATGDGQRFLVRSAVEQASTTPITVVVNWTAEVKR
ncbi:MAG: protein kinase, partial [Acidobacteriota bacterium]|nr:protein kinase [Acidobacteriota bacterium]